MFYPFHYIFFSSLHRFAIKSFLIFALLHYTRMLDQVILLSLTYTLNGVEFMRRTSKSSDARRKGHMLVKADQQVTRSDTLSSIAYSTH